MGCLPESFLSDHLHDRPQQYQVPQSFATVYNGQRSPFKGCQLTKWISPQIQMGKRQGGQLAPQIAVDNSSAGLYL